MKRAARNAYSLFLQAYYFIKGFMRMRLFISFMVVLLSSCMLYAQEKTEQDSTAKTPLSLSERVAMRSMYQVVGDIQLSGNKKTRDFIIFREIPFKKGERIADSELDKLLELARQQIMNTLLFVDVNVYVAAKKGNVLIINVDLKERWYFFPTPYFRLVDRNFNQWWVDQKRSLDRVNYGIKFIQNNTTGRNDNLNIWLINGYTQQFTIRYDIPFIDKKLTKGFNIGLYGLLKKS